MTGLKKTIRTQQAYIVVVHPSHMIKMRCSEGRQRHETELPNILYKDWL